MTDQQGIIWKRFPGLAMAGGAEAGHVDFARFGARLQRDLDSSWSVGTAIAVYEMPDDLLRAPTPLALQLFDPPLYLPEHPTTPVRTPPRVGRLHARIFYSVGSTGLLRVDCDWVGSVPLVAHKALSVYVVADSVLAAADPAYWQNNNYNYRTDTTISALVAGELRFNAALPPAPSSVPAPPTIAYLARHDFVPSAADPFVDFIETHPDATSLFLKVSWGATSHLEFTIDSVTPLELEDNTTYLELAITLTSGQIDETLADSDQVSVRLESVDPLGRIDVAAALVLGDRASVPPPTYTYPSALLGSETEASFPAPAFARKLRLAIQWGVAAGSPADAPLGQYFVAFRNRTFGFLGWIDLASSRVAAFGDGIHVPPGTDQVVLSNRSPDAVTMTPSFVLGL